MLLPLWNYLIHYPSLITEHLRGFQPQRDVSETDKCTPPFSSWQAGETCGGSISHSDVFSLWNTSRAFRLPFIFRYLGFPHTITQPWTFESKLRSWKLLVHFQVGTEHFSPLDVSAPPPLITNKHINIDTTHTLTDACYRGTGLEVADGSCQVTLICDMAARMASCQNSSLNAISLSFHLSGSFPLLSKQLWGQSYTHREKKKKTAKWSRASRPNGACRTDVGG